MELLDPAFQPVAAGAAAYVFSRMPHPDTAAADVAAFVDAATGESLSFVALRRGALSLASGLRLGLGLRRGDAVLILSPNNSLLLPQILLGVLAAGGVAVAADPDATPAEISSAAHGSGAAIIVAAPEVAAKAAGAGVPLLLTTRSLDPRTLSVEELIDGGDPTALPLPVPEEAASDVLAFAAYSSASKTVAMTHGDLVAAAADVVGSPDHGRVCLASLPMCSVHGLPLLALGLPAARVTTVLMSPPSDPRAAREAVVAHGATYVVATPEVAAVLAAPVPQDGKLSSLRRVTVVAPVPLAAEARLEFRRRLPWVELTELYSTAENETGTATEEVQMTPAELGAPELTQTDAPLIHQTDQMSVTRETASPVRTLKKMQKIIFSRLSTSKNLTRKEPENCIRQAASKL